MQISWWKITIPALLGLGATAWLIASEVDMEVLAGLKFTLKTVLFILLAFVFMAGRDLGYMLRIRLFARGELSWKQAFRVIMLWEFTSAVTPSTIGGTAVAVVYVHKEGLSVGKSAALVMLTAFFDELFFALCFPLLILVVGWDTLFGFSGASALMPVVIAGYCVKLALTLVLSYGLFFNPRGLGRFIVKLFSVRILKRWKDKAQQTADDLILSSKEIRNYNAWFWVKAFGATALSWTSRFLVANAIFLAFVTVSDHFLVFARQLAMWVPMIVSPTPGGAGFAEYIFGNFLGDVITGGGAGMTPIIALLWRGVTFYPYLIIGALIIPRWLAKVVKAK
ncbi:MAG: lysylphosphatidylglycerol synthase transmembrane domain-containing protein [Rikenellaceae bacterium]